ncbi:hypothetical protein [Cupriavidus necator]|uniref:hypothetical protein n=1 Tax=Cupriavidus necator TaxID=106590 RepID=UPI0038572DAD
MPNIYRRPALADRMTRQLLRPGVLDEGLRSGLFLSGLRRTGKTTFLINDLVPALEADGAILIYVDLCHAGTGAGGSGRQGEDQRCPDRR